jgi:flagellar FliJ protein
MSALDQLIRLHRWRLEDERRKMADLQRLADKLVEQIAGLDENVMREAAATKASGTPELVKAFAAYADLSRLRRDKLERSRQDVETRIETARELVLETFRELEKYEQAQRNRQAKRQAELKRRERISEDEVGIDRHRRRS